ncbi:glycosidase, partial [PVC group bacterium]|nr:glycosidase [PVC group bacterium]
MIQRHENNPIIKPTDIIPSRDDFEVIGVFNAAAIQRGTSTFLLLRVAERPKNENQQNVIVSYWNAGTREIETKIFSKNSSTAEFDDPRIVRTKEKIYLTSLSHFRAAWSEDGVNFKIGEKPCFSPQTSYETYGVEDPRLQLIEGRTLLTYSAVSGNGIATALAEWDSREKFNRKGLIFLANNRNVVLFPEKIQGKYLALHRPFGHGWSEGDIWMATSPDLLHWGEYKILMGPRPGFWDHSKIGAGAPPFKTEHGW